MQTQQRPRGRAIKHHTRTHHAVWASPQPRSARLHRMRVAGNTLEAPCCRTRRRCRVKHRLRERESVPHLQTVPIVSPSTCAQPASATALPCPPLILDGNRFLGFVIFQDCPPRLPGRRPRRPRPAAAAERPRPGRPPRRLPPAHRPAVAFHHFPCIDTIQIHTPLRSTLGIITCNSDNKLLEMIPNTRYFITLY